MCWGSHTKALVGTKGLPSQTGHVASLFGFLPVPLHNGHSVYVLLGSPQCGHFSALIETLPS